MKKFEEELLEVTPELLSHVIYCHCHIDGFEAALQELLSIKFTLKKGVKEDILPGFDDLY